ncbi:hypothetical protein KM043_003545 [Ampulex compressa]|nr:hypothetical protein KM043_003545 [Ampulex compressa]
MIVEESVVLEETLAWLEARPFRNSSHITRTLALEYNPAVYGPEVANNSALNSLLSFGQNFTESSLTSGCLGRAAKNTILAGRYVPGAQDRELTAQPRAERADSGETAGPPGRGSLFRGMSPAFENKLGGYAPVFRVDARRIADFTPKTNHSEVDGSTTSWIIGMPAEIRQADGSCRPNRGTLGLVSLVDCSSMLGFFQGKSIKTAQ